MQSGVKSTEGKGYCYATYSVCRDGLKKYARHAKTKKRQMMKYHEYQAAVDTKTSSSALILQPGASPAESSLCIAMLHSHPASLSCSPTLHLYPASPLIDFMSMMRSHIKYIVCRLFHTDQLHKALVLLCVISKEYLHSTMFVCCSADCTHCVCRYWSTGNAVNTWSFSCRKNTHSSSTLRSDTMAATAVALLLLLLLLLPPQLLLLLLQYYNYYCSTATTTPIPQYYYCCLTTTPLVLLLLLLEYYCSTTAVVL